MDALELARWTRFASKGGIGKCTALRDHIAQDSEDLMFLENDEIIVLMQISVSDDLYLGSCEGVVGRFYGSDVRVHGKLKKPVFTKRPTSVTTSASPTPPSSRAPTFSSPPLIVTTPDSDASSRTSGSDYLSRNPSVTYGSPLPSTPAAQTPESSSMPSSPIPTVSVTEDVESDSGTEEGQVLEIRVQSDAERSNQLTAVPTKDFTNFRRPVLSTIYVSATGPHSSPTDIVTPTVYAEGGSQTGQLAGSSTETRSLYAGGSIAQYDDDEEEREETPAYAGRSSVFLTDRASTFSDGRVGIGLSLLQGMQNGDRMSDLWSESGESGESIADHHFPPPPNTVPFGVRGSKVSSSNTEGGKRSATATRASMRSMGVSEAGEWDGEDIYGEYYRNSRTSVNSKFSGRSRTTSNTNAQHEVPPIPDLEYRRPSLETESISSARSPTPEEDSVRDGPPQPTSLLPEKTRPLNIRKGNSPTIPEPPSFRNNYNMVGSASPVAGSSALGVASVMRQTLESDGVESSISSSRPSQNTEPVIGGSPTRSPHSGVPSGNSKGLSFPPVPPPSQEPQARPRVQNGNSATALGMPRAPSLFMPHPHAPKAMDPSTGQVSSRSQAIYEAMSSNKDVLQSTTPVKTPGYSMSLLGMLAFAATKARVKATTVYGQTPVDLSTSFNPVPITFSLDGQPENSKAARNPGPKTGQIGRSNTSDGVMPESPKKVAPIPRANFFPKAGTPRPRSRSFSGFAGSEVAIPMATSLEEGSNPGDGIASLRASLRPQKRGRTSPSVNGTSSPRSGSPSNQAPHGRIPRPTHVPSPLSLPAIYSPETEPFPSFDIPPSPLSPMAPPSPGASSIKHPGISRGLRQIASNAMLKVGIQPDSSSRVTRDNSGTYYHEPPPSPSRRDSPPRVLRRSPSNLRVPPPPTIVSTEVDSDREIRGDLSIPLLSNGSASSSPIVRNISLRSKLSKSGLRGRQGGGRGYEHPASRPGSTHQDNDEARVQFQDMEFELIKPVIKAPGVRESEDGGGSVISASNSSTREGEASDSPILSPSTGSRYSAGFNSSVDLYAGSSRAPVHHSAASVEAHRIREQKWMSLILTSSNSQARKNKKVRKLILDGVPSSVRGKVWGAITDAKARRMEGLFTQLVRKAPSHFIPLVERDVERCFGDVQHLRDPKGPLASLILAYTAMVPDIRYRTGLTLIAGHLLLQAPDEDAFWMFVAIMDSHLRGYYQINSHGQIEVDSTLFKLLVQAADPELAQRLFEDYGIRPIDICGPWFSCMFAGIVPPDHLYRLWDVLLYDGPIYLFRIALTLLSLLKRPLMNMPPPEVPNVLDLLQRPPVAALPPDPDGLLAHTFNVKFRDDDVRKQRSKLEAQLKQQRAGAR